MGGEHTRLGCQPGDEQAHLALFYSGDAHYVDQVMGFLTPALQAGDPVAVAIPPDRARTLQPDLGPDRPGVHLLDMAQLGRNPARIIPTVLCMLDEHRGRTLHYVGEPVWPGRSTQEIQEATRHEALINLAWPDADIRVLCPYDAEGLEPRVLRDAERTHPWLLHAGAVSANPRYTGASFPAGTDDALDPAPANATGLEFGPRDLSAVRTLVRTQAAGAGLPAGRVDDLVMAVNELATNAIKHGGGGGRLRTWRQDSELVCQLEDEGHIADPLAGHHRPVATIQGGMGLWMVNQLCDLVEVRTRPRGTVIRLHTRTGH